MGKFGGKCSFDKNLIKVNTKHKFFANSIVISGPDLPIQLREFSMVSFNDTVVAIGGKSFGYNSNSLFKLVCSDQICEWKEMSQKLRTGRFGFVAMLIPEEMADCQ